MYPHHVFDLEPAGTLGMYPICYWQVSGRYFQPETAMYSRCFCWFPGPLAPSVNRVFHVLLLRPHIPNDDRCFPGRMPCQIPGFREKPEEWIIDSILSHHGKGLESEFQVLWKVGDKMWVPYHEVAHLNTLDQYCELMGVKNIFELSSNYIYGVGHLVTATW